MSAFWKNWLNLWCAGVTLFGVILALTAFAPTDGLARLVFTLFQTPLPNNMDNLHRFSIGLMGAVTMGWGMTLYVAFQAAHLLDPAHAPRIWRSVTIVALIWYVVDSYISVATGYWMNAVSNTLIMALYLIAIWRSGAAHNVT
jgi:hypothetical protein